MIYVGIDPGNAYVGVAVIYGTTLRLSVIRGKTQPRPTKKNPKPAKLNPYVQAHEVAVAVLDAAGITSLPVDVHGERDFRVGIEAGAISANGRQDALAACRQAVFEQLSHRVGIFAAASMFKPIVPSSAKVALTTYRGADKRRMVEMAGKRIDAEFPAMLDAWNALADKEREAAADALAIALTLRDRDST
jgi:Holliday junction resolvasome RuvABC endonuclease subunit